MMPRACAMAAALVHLALTHSAEADDARKDRSSAARAPPYTNLMGHSLPDMGRVPRTTSCRPHSRVPVSDKSPGSLGLTSRLAGWQRGVRGTSPTSSPTPRPAILCDTFECLGTTYRVLEQQAQNYTGPR